MNSKLKLAINLPKYKLFRDIGYPEMLPFNYTFLVSTRCNSRCKTCNIWKQRHGDFDIGQWKQVFKSIGKSPFWVTISGGEPFLQPHLSEMVVTLDKICQPAIINIPTNSLLGDKIAKDVVKILAKVKCAQVIVNLSLDGVGKQHDQIRGIPGNFDKVMANYENLKKIQDRYPNFAVGFATVISRFNVNKIEDVVDLVFGLEPDQYVTEIAEERVELDTKGSGITPGFREYCQAIDYLMAKMREHKFVGIGRVSRGFRFEYYGFVKDWLKGRKFLADYAGFASCEVTSWGDIWPSCINSEVMGNLKDVDYDFSKIWFSPRADKIREKVKTHGTSYPLANAYYSSALFDLPTVFRVAKNILLR